MKTIRFNSQHNWGALYGSFNERENIQFDNEGYIHMSSQDYKESDYSLDLDFLPIVH